jgi:hypothetical protein
MYDLSIRYSDRPPAAVEVTAAADAGLIELWNLINGRGDGRWEEPNLKGGWSIELAPDARAKELRAKLPDLLRRLEGHGVEGVDPSGRAHGPFETELLALGVTHAIQLPTHFTGSIYPTFKPRAGFVPSSGTPLLDWIGPWLREPGQADNLFKLAASGAIERHLFVFLPGFTTAPFGVDIQMMKNQPILPDSDPDLPTEITHLWLMSTWSDGQGLRWGPDTGWKLFEKVGHE